MKQLAAAVGIGMAVAYIAAPAASATGAAVQPTKSSVTAWTKTASHSAMVTTEIGEGDSKIICKIAVNQASDCTARIPGNPASQTITNSDASKQWIRTLPNGKWKVETTAANVNPVANTERFYSYDPFTPWTAKASLGVSWSMKKANGEVVIESHIKNFGEDQHPDTTVTISQNGKRFTLATGDSQGPASSTSGVLKPVSVTIPN